MILRKKIEVDAIPLSYHTPLGITNNILSNIQLKLFYPCSWCSNCERQYLVKARSDLMGLKYFIFDRSCEYMAEITINRSEVHHMINTSARKGVMSWISSRLTMMCGSW